MSYATPSPYPTQFSPYPNYGYNRPPKIELPRFNSGDEALSWLAMAERYLKAQKVPPHEKVATIASHFGPEASVWMNAFETRNPAGRDLCRHFWVRAQRFQSSTITSGAKDLGG